MRTMMLLLFKALNYDHNVQAPAVVSYQTHLHRLIVRCGNASTSYGKQYLAFILWLHGWILCREGTFDIDDPTQESCVHGDYVEDVPENQEVDGQDASEFPCDLARVDVVCIETIQQQWSAKCASYIATVAVCLLTTVSATIAYVCELSDLSDIVPTYFFMICTLLGCLSMCTAAQDSAETQVLPDPSTSTMMFRKYRYYELTDEFPSSDSDQESDSEAKAVIAIAAQQAAIDAAKKAKQSRARNAKNRKLARSLA